MGRRDSRSGSRKGGRRMEKIDVIKLQMLKQMYQLMHDISTGRGR